MIVLPRQVTVTSPEAHARISGSGTPLDAGAAFTIWRVAETGPDGRRRCARPEVVFEHRAPCCLGCFRTDTDGVARQRLVDSVSGKSLSQLLGTSGWAEASRCGMNDDQRARGFRLRLHLRAPLPGCLLRPPIRR